MIFIQSRPQTALIQSSLLFTGDPSPQKPKLSEAATHCDVSPAYDGSCTFPRYKNRLLEGEDGDETFPAARGALDCWRTR